VFKAANYLNPEDFDKFLGSFDGMNNYKAKPELLRLAAQIEYYCALRISEVLTLRKEDFDLNHRILTLQHTKTGHKRCKCSTWDYTDSHSKVKTKLISVDESCKKCKGTAKIRIKQYTSIPKPLIGILSIHLQTIKGDKPLFQFGRITAWKYYKQAGVKANLEIRELQKERSIEGVWTHLLRKSYLKFMRNNGASVELCEVKARHIERHSIDHYLRPDIESLKIWEAKIFD
jgi:integrase